MSESQQTATRSKAFPPWLSKRLPAAYDPQVRDLLAGLRLATVCQEARCPNLGECWHSGTATFLILGRECTRACPYCNVVTHKPSPPDAMEPERLAEAAARMSLKHVVITSVCRDDLPDGGAAHWAAVIRAVRASCAATIEALVPDFRRKQSALEVVLAEGVDVLNHNVECVPRLYATLRPGAEYAFSIELLARAKKIAPRATTKSGLMVGLGETEAESLDVMRDLRKAGVDIVTIGQYLRPTAEHHAIQRFAPPEEFKRYEAAGQEMGFKRVFAGPFVRSSYRAGEACGPPSLKIAPE
jgi:lipoyl synthase